MARSRKKTTESATTADEMTVGEEPAVTEPVSESDEALTEPAADPGSVEQASEPAEPDPTGDPAHGTGDEPEPETSPIAEDTGPAEPRPDPETVPPARRGGFVPLVLGGAVAAGLGFAAAYFLPQLQDQGAADERAALAGEVQAQAGTIAALSADIEALRADPAIQAAADAQSAFAEQTAADLAALRDTLAGLNASMAERTERLDAVDARLAALEKRPVEGGAASATALEAFGREMEALRAEIAAQTADTAAARDQIAAAADAATTRIEAAEAETARLHAEAAEAARAAAVRAAIGRLQAALDSGTPLDSGLADLAAAGETPPPSLVEQAQGVPSLSVLRESFPPAARAALSASLKETADGSTWDRMTAFLRSQSGARSLSPRAGDDPDAILSRAEAALGVGDLSTAVAEIGALPEVGQARMNEWVKMAERRMDAVKAVAALAETVK